LGLLFCGYGQGKGIEKGEEEWMGTSKKKEWGRFCLVAHLKDRHGAKGDEEDYKSQGETSGGG